ncbi:serine/threonine-protein phosphatase 7 long form homolog [Henckelia pumila]|uniref:serine/threonine-protein phosphatase 7 long form homolog n=1 Tax=Henckelia pumila TaxID=405737 RepID=UPI003C6E5AF2
MSEGEIVRHPELRAATASAVRRRPEEELALDLYGRGGFISLRQAEEDGANDVVAVGQRKAVNLGPRDPSVLYSQATHISTIISKNNLDTILTVKRSDNLIWELFKHNLIHNRVRECLHRMGFYGIFRCGYHGLDNHLITALVERWRRETHTFHLPVGETTITLQDIEIIWGLKVDGIAVTGIDTLRKRHEWQQICFDLLGFAPALGHLKGGHLSLTALNEHCIQMVINDDSTEQEVAQYSRCVALMTIGGCMLPDSQGGAVKLMYLQHLQDINRVSEYGWGSATLAYLYRELCNASTIGKNQIAGPLYILQIWAWSRMPTLSPGIHEQFLTAPRDDHQDVIMPVAPYGARWKLVNTFTHTASHAVRIIRDILDHMEENQFLWNVYDPKAPDVRSLTPDEELTTVWRSVCPLVCFDIVEMHRPNRVMRQFGMRQSIPIPATNGDELHRLTRQGRRNYDWAVHHQGYLAQWENRHGLVVSSGYHHGVHPTTRDYKRWYDQITVRFISPTTRGAGYRTGDAPFRSLVTEEAMILMSRFEGLSLREQSHEALVEVVNDSRRIGRRLYELANRDQQH